MTINKKVLYLVLTLLTGITASAQQRTAPGLKDGVGIEEIVAGMSLEEKARLVTGTGMRFGGNGPVIGDADGRVPGAAGNTFSIARLGIPGTVMADGPGGIRMEPFRGKDSTRSWYATAWPVSTLLASSWDTALLRKVGTAFGNEVKEYGIDIILAPGMNIQRDPLCGRNFEYYSEDPLISGNMAAAMINGLQLNGTGVSVKHFAANNQETNRNNVDVVMSERALREIYLKGFEIAVKQSRPLTVMSSYNKLNGRYTSENPELLTTILRDEWKFTGIVMTDWFGGKDPVAQMNAGNDLLMPGTPQQVQKIIDAVNSGTLDIGILDRNVRRILTVIRQLPSFMSYSYSNKPDLAAHAALERAAAAESMVLLKNERKVLPLKVKQVALFGNASYDPIIGGTGSGATNAAYTVSLPQGLLQAGYTVDEGLKKMYLEWIDRQKAGKPKPRLILGPVKMLAEPGLSLEQITTSADNNQAAIITIGRNAGEGADRKKEGDFYLDEQETTLLKNISAAFHAKGKPVIVILNIGGVIGTADWRDMADAILLAWQPGQEAGNAIADVLSGKTTPSGKLATTFPLKYEDSPASRNFPGMPADNPRKVIYEEDIYVGYRYYHTFGVKPAYAFGHGLSYTSFRYEKLSLSSSGFKDSLQVTLTITNTGTTTGREVVQLYLAAPAKKIDKPAIELKAFAKTALLQPGRSETIRFTLHLKDISSFDTSRQAWMAEEGSYTVKVGAASDDIRQTAVFQLPKELIGEKVHPVLLPQEKIQQLSNRK